MARSKQNPVPTELTRRIAAIKVQITALEVQASATGGHLGAKVRAQELIGQLRESLIRAEAEKVAIQRGESDLERVLRHQSWAAASGSWVAAQKYATQVEEIRDRMAREAEHARPAEADLSPEELAEVIVGAVQSLPEASLVRLREAIEHRIGAGAPPLAAPALRLVADGD